MTTATELVEAGAFLAGEGLQPSATGDDGPFARGGERIVSDGPFAETKEQVGGFYLLECGDLDEALEWAKKTPVRRAARSRSARSWTSGDGYEDPNAAKAAAS